MVVLYDHWIFCVVELIHLQEDHSNIGLMFSFLNSLKRMGQLKIDRHNLLEQVRNVHGVWELYFYEVLLLFHLLVSGIHNT